MKKFTEEDTHEEDRIALIRAAAVGIREEGRMLSGKGPGARGTRIVELCNRIIDLCDVGVKVPPKEGD
jgi:hypothetical protein